MTNHNTTSETTTFSSSRTETILQCSTTLIKTPSSDLIIPFLNVPSCDNMLDIEVGLGLTQVFQA